MRTSSNDYNGYTSAELFGFLLTLHLLNLLTLLFQFLLLLLELCLSLLVGVLIVLHRVTDYIASATAQNTADRRARARRADGGTDDRAGCRADTRTAYSALLTGRQWLPGASSYKKKCREGECTGCNCMFAHNPYLASYSTSLWLFNC